MGDIYLGEVEARFADIIWNNEPLTSRRLAELALEKLNWKKSTTYTVLKRLCDRGIFRNDNGTVTSVLSREEYLAIQSESFVEETFSGSLPAFVAAFTSRNRLSAEEIRQLQRLIDASREDEVC